MYVYLRNRIWNWIIYKVDMLWNLTNQPTYRLKIVPYSYTDQVSKVFVNCSGNRSSIPDRVIPKTQKMVLDTSLLNTQHYKARIKGKVEQSRERSGTLPYTSVLYLLKREPSGYPRLGLPILLVPTQLSPIIRKTRVLSQLGSYQNSKKWCLMIPYLTLYYKVRIKRKVKQSKERSSAFHYSSV